MNIETLPIIVGGILVAVVVLIIVIKFGRIITNLLTIFGGLVALTCIYLLYQAISSGIDLHTIKALLEMFK